MDEIRDLRDLFAGHAIQSTYPDKAAAEKAFEQMMAAYDTFTASSASGSAPRCDSTPGQPA
jgi:hypothetical protein